MQIDIEYKRLKQIRQELKLTQAQFAKRLALPSSTADIERGRTRISGHVVMILLRDYHINPLWLYGESDRKHLLANAPGVVPKVITTNSQGIENILIVDAKASAGYGQNIGDPEFYEQLPAFDFPLPDYRNASFRGFQISGDSMTPLVHTGDYVLAKAVESFDDVINGSIYIIVQEESIRLKKVQKKEGILTLISLNPEYGPQDIYTESILEMWEYHSKISTKQDNESQPTMQLIYNELQEVKDYLSS